MIVGPQSSISHFYLSCRYYKGQSSTKAKINTSIRPSGTQHKNLLCSERKPLTIWSFFPLLPFFPGRESFMIQIRGILIFCPSLVYHTFHPSFTQAIVRSSFIPFPSSFHPDPTSFKLLIIPLPNQS